MAENIKFFYARVSTKEQNEARQIEEAKKLGIDNRYIFLDKQTGKNFEREQYKAMLGLLREGDEVYISSLDRLGRNYKMVVEEWKRITETIKAHIIVMDMDLLDTRKNRDLTGVLLLDIVLRLLSYVAESETKNRKERQMGGIAIAKANGVYKGRKPVEVDKVLFEKIYSEVVRKERPNCWAMKQLGLKPNTYYNFTKDFKNRTGMWSDND